jgi:hypothetical protein
MNRMRFDKADTKLLSEIPGPKSEGALWGRRAKRGLEKALGIERRILLPPDPAPSDDQVERPARKARDEQGRQPGRDRSNLEKWLCA